MSKLVKREWNLIKLQFCPPTNSSSCSDIPLSSWNCRLWSPVSSVDSYYCLFDLHFKWPPSLPIYQSITVTATEQSDTHLQSLCLHIRHLIIIRQCLMNTTLHTAIKVRVFNKIQWRQKIIQMIWSPLCSEHPDENGQTRNTVHEAAYRLPVFCKAICFSEDEMRPLEKKKKKKSNGGSGRW